MKTVVDLNAGIGGRIIAFSKQGFEIKEVYEIDNENIEYLSNFLGNKKVHHVNIAEVDPISIQDADVFTFKYLQQSFSIVGKTKKTININDVIYKIIKVKRPKYILMEVPPSTVLRSKEILETYLSQYLEIRYSFSYKMYDESQFSGVPMIGKQAFFIGIYGEKMTSFEFPSPLEVHYKEMMYDDITTIDKWYRAISFDTSQMIYSKWYIKTFKSLVESETLHMGGPRECYVVDKIGPRRFTHNELARLKGLDIEDYNQCKNKRRMYQKIAYASNVYIK